MNVLLARLFSAVLRGLGVRGVRNKRRFVNGAGDRDNGGIGDMPNDDGSDNVVGDSPISGGDAESDVISGEFVETTVAGVDDGDDSYEGSGLGMIVQGLGGHNTGQGDVADDDGVDLGRDEGEDGGEPYRIMDDDVVGDGSDTNVRDREITLISDARDGSVDDDVNGELVAQSAEMARAMDDGGQCDEDDDVAVASGNFVDEDMAAVDSGVENLTAEDEGVTVGDDVLENDELRDRAEDRRDDREGLPKARGGWEKSPPNRRAGVGGGLTIGGFKPPQHPPRRYRSGKYYERIKPYERRVALRCREIGGLWHIVAEAPMERGIESISLGDVDLSLDDYGEIALSCFTGFIETRYDDGSVERTQLIDGRMIKPFLFKVGKGWREGGSHIGTATDGFVIAICLADSEVDFGPGVIETQEPEPCADKRFMARLLEVEGRGAINKTREPEIMGRLIYDDADTNYDGRLFIGDVPIVKADDGVLVARIVEEVGDPALFKDAWACDFDPHGEPLDAVLSGREGWFGLRFYGAGGLEHNPPIRYLRDLRRILLDGREYRRGDRVFMRDADIAIRFEGLRSADIMPITDGIEITDDGAIISGDIASGDVWFNIRGAGVCIKPPRLRWRLESDAEGSFGNDCLEFAKDEFLALADGWIAVKGPKWLDDAQIGYRQQNALLAQGRGGKLRFNLAHFASHSAIRELEEGEIDLRIFACGESAVLARIRAARVDLDAQRRERTPIRMLDDKIFAIIREIRTGDAFILDICESADAEQGVLAWDDSLGSMDLKIGDWIPIVVIEYDHHNICRLRLGSRREFAGASVDAFFEAYAAAGGRAAAIKGNKWRKRGLSRMRKERE